MIYAFYSELLFHLAYVLVILLVSVELEHENCCLVCRLVIFPPQIHHQSW